MQRTPPILFSHNFAYIKSLSPNFLRWFLIAYGVDVRSSRSRNLPSGSNDASLTRSGAGLRRPDFQCFLLYCDLTFHTDSNVYAPDDTCTQQPEYVSSKPGTTLAERLEAAWQRAVHHHAVRDPQVSVASCEN